MGSVQVTKKLIFNLKNMFIYSILLNICHTKNHDIKTAAIFNVLCTIKNIKNTKKNMKIGIISVLSNGQPCNKKTRLIKGCLA